MVEHMTDQYPCESARMNQSLKNVFHISVLHRSHGLLRFAYADDPPGR